MQNNNKLYDDNDAMIRSAFLKIKEDITSLNLKIDGMSDNISSLKEDIEELKINLASKDMLTSIEREIIILKQSTYPKLYIDKHIGTINQELESMNHSVSSHETKLERLKEISEIKKEVEKIDAKLLPKKDLKKLITDLNKDLVFLDQRLTELEKEGIDLEQIESSFVSKKVLSKDLESYTTQLKNHIIDMESKINKIEDQISLVEEDAVTKDHLSKIQDDIIALRPQIVDHDELDELKESLAAHENRLSRKNEQEVISTHKKIKAIEKSINEMNTKFSRESESANSEIISLNKQILALKDTKQSLKQLNKELNTLKKKR